MNRYDYEDPFAAGNIGRQLRIFDRSKGCDKPIAFCDDTDIAQRIVDLLNADEKAREKLKGVTE